MSSWSLQKWDRHEYKIIHTVSICIHHFACSLQMHSEHEIKHKMNNYTNKPNTLCMCNFCLFSIFWFELLLFLWFQLLGLICYCCFLLEVFQSGCSLYFNSVQHAKLYFLCYRFMLHKHFIITIDNSQIFHCYHQ